MYSIKPDIDVFVNYFIQLSKVHTIAMLTHAVTVKRVSCSKKK